MPAAIATAITSLQVIFFGKNNVIVFVIIKMYALRKIIITTLHLHCSLKQDQAANLHQLFFRAEKNIYKKLFYSLQYQGFHNGF